MHKQTTYDVHDSPDAGVLGLACDGYLQPLALCLRVTYQRVQQLLAADPLAQFLRLFRPLCRFAPARAESLIKYLQTIFDEERGAVTPVERTRAELVARLAREAGECVAEAISGNGFERQLKEALEAQQANHDYVEFLREQMRLNDRDGQADHAAQFGGQAGREVGGVH